MAEGKCSSLYVQRGGYCRASCGACQVEGSAGVQAVICDDLPTPGKTSTHTAGQWLVLCPLAVFVLAVCLWHEHGMLNPSLRLAAPASLPPGPLLPDPADGVTCMVRWAWVMMGRALVYA